MHSWSGDRNDGGADVLVDCERLAQDPRFAADFPRSAELLRRALRAPADAGRGRVLAVVDTAPALDVEDLAGADVEVRRFGDAGPTTATAHATHAACLLVGQGRAALRGLVPRARLLVAAIAEEDECVDPRAIADAITWASGAGAEVLALPLGAHHEDELVLGAVRQALQRRVIVVAAAGNAHPHPVLFPARLPGVLAVGACDGRGALLEDCCREPRLDLVLPALAIRAPVARGRLATRSGTSVATTLAAGLVMRALRAGALQQEQGQEERWQT